MLEHIQPPIQQNLPSLVSDNMPGMSRAACIQFPGEFDSHRAAGLLDLLEAFLLLLPFEIIFDRYQMDRYFIFLRFLSNNGSQQ